MKKLVPVIFFIVASSLAAFFVFHKNKIEEETETVGSKIITPIVDSTSIDSQKVGLEDEDNISMTTFVTLKGDETLISTLSADFDGDSYDDQIIAIKRSFSPYIILMLCLYNPSKQIYERSGEIATEITQARTFAYTSMDLTGDHKNALIYQGYLSNGNSVFKAYFLSRKSSVLNLNEIANFESDGTIYIQQLDRYEAYEMAQAKGSSYPIWVNTSDQKSSNKTLDQLQREYDWNSVAGKYTLVREIRVPGSKIAADELEKIQDGTTETFTNFLSGMWYKTSDNGNSIRYLLFDTLSDEIIFLYNDTEEVYTWVSSNVRRNGMYISGINIDISSLERRFDISLESMDSIRIRLQDDVRMPITENTQWDGQYKKMSQQNDFRKKTEKIKSEESKNFVKTLEASTEWHTPDGRTIAFDKGTYSLTGDGITDYGMYSGVIVPNTSIVQFKSQSVQPALMGMYLMVGIPDENGAYDRISLSPVILTPEGVVYSEGHEIVLEKGLVPAPVIEAPVIVPVKKEEKAVEKLPPVINVRLTPQYFSPDGDGNNDNLTIFLNAAIQNNNSLANWSFVINDPETKKVFWSINGKSVLSDKIIWNGKNSRGEFVQSATDYPYKFTVTDSEGLTQTAEGFIQVDVLVIREGDKLKLQVPSIIFRSDHADFKSIAEVEAGPEYDKESKGLDKATIDNNIRVLRRIAEILQKFRDYSVTIEGNANNLTGTAAEEVEVKQLSLDRAKFVRTWLIEKGGISAARLTATGNGSKNPVTRNLDYRWQNRRVEFILKK